MSRYTPANKLIGQRIRDARSIAQLSQRALGERIGIGAKRIGEYERGEITIPAPLLAVLAYQINFDVNDLLPKGRISALLKMGARQ